MVRIGVGLSGRGGVGLPNQGRVGSGQDGVGPRGQNGEGLSHRVGAGVGLLSGWGWVPVVRIGCGTCTHISATLCRLSV